MTEVGYRSSTTIKVVSLIVAILSGGYMAPWAIAAFRDIRHTAVFWVNLLLGWTIVGWIVALVMSLRQKPQFAVVNVTDYTSPSSGQVITGTVVSSDGN